MVWKPRRAGYGSPGGLVELVGGLDGCPLGCGDPECQEWSDARFLDGRGWTYHMSECELEAPDYSEWDEERGFQLVAPFRRKKRECCDCQVIVDALGFWAELDANGCIHCDAGLEQRPILEDRAAGEEEAGFVREPESLAIAVVAAIALVGGAVAAVWFNVGFWIKAGSISLAVVMVAGFPARCRQIRTDQEKQRLRLAGTAPGQGKQKTLEDLRDRYGGQEAIGSEELPQLLAENPNRRRWEGIPDLDQPTGIGRAFIERYLAGSKRNR